MKFRMLAVLVTGFALVASPAMAQSKKKAAEPAAATTSHSESASSVKIQDEGAYGLGFGFPTGGGGTINGSYFLKQDRALRVDLGIDLDKAGAGASFQFGWSLDVGYRMYCKKAGPVAVFGQPGLFIARAASAGAEVSVGPSYAIGAEYFFNDSLSFGISSGLNLTFAKSFDSIRINTGTTALTGTFYW